MGFFGMTSTCTGACGDTSWNAKQSSSSKTILAVISLRMILEKMVSAMEGFFSEDGCGAMLAAVQFGKLASKLRVILITNPMGFAAHRVWLFFEVS